MFSIYELNIALTRKIKIKEEFLEKIRQVHLTPTLLHTRLISSSLNINIQKDRKGRAK